MSWPELRGHSVQEVVVKVEAASGTDLLLNQRVLLEVAVPDLGVQEEDQDHSHGGCRHEQGDHLTRSLKPGHLETIRVSRVTVWSRCLWDVTTRPNMSQTCPTLAKKSLKLHLLQNIPGYPFVFNCSDSVHMMTNMFHWQNPWDTLDLGVTSHRHRVMVTNLMSPGSFTVNSDICAHHRSPP